MKRLFAKVLNKSPIVFESQVVLDNSKDKKHHAYFAHGEILDRMSQQHSEDISTNPYAEEALMHDIYKELISTEWIRSADLPCLASAEAAKAISDASDQHSSKSGGNYPIHHPPSHCSGADFSGTYSILEDGGVCYMESRCERHYDEHEKILMQDIYQEIIARDWVPANDDAGLAYNHHHAPLLDDDNATIITVEDNATIILSLTSPAEGITTDADDASIISQNDAQMDCPDDAQHLAMLRARSKTPTPAAFCSDAPKAKRRYRRFSTTALELAALAADPDSACAEETPCHMDSMPANAGACLSQARLRRHSCTYYEAPADKTRMWLSEMQDWVTHAQHQELLGPEPLPDPLGSSPPTRPGSATGG